MNATDPSQPPALPEAKHSGEPAAPRPGGALSGLALLVGLAALAGSAWLWWSDFRDRGAETARLSADSARIGQLEANVDRQLRELESRVAELARQDAGDAAGLERQVASLRSGLQQAVQASTESAALSRTLQTGLEGTHARLAGLEARFDSLAARGLDAGTELDLAELDFLLRLAQERLRLFLDVRSADRALEVAAEHVAALDNPVYGGLQREIDSARRALATVDMPEPGALDRELDTVQVRLATLPFRGGEALGGDEPRGEPPTTAGDGGWWQRLKAALSGLVTVRRTTAESEALPALVEQELIRQRAWLEVERIRLAAMRHDQSAYEAALERARATITRWFTPQHRGTRAALQALESAAALDVEPALPDISGPLVALRALRIHERNAPGRAPGEPGPSATPEPRTPGATGPETDEAGEGDDGGQGWPGTESASGDADAAR